MQSNPTLALAQNVNPNDGRDPVRTQKINDAMRLYGLPEADATKLADGVIEIVTNPFDGSSVLVDKATGQRRPLTLAGPAPPPSSTPTQPPAAPAEPGFQPALADVSNYGIAGAAPEMAEKGTFGLFGASPETLHARQRQRVLR